MKDLKRKATTRQQKSATQWHATKATIKTYTLCDKKKNWIYKSTQLYWCIHYVYLSPNEERKQNNIITQMKIVINTEVNMYRVSHCFFKKRKPLHFPNKTLIMFTLSWLITCVYFLWQNRYQFSYIASCCTLDKAVYSTMRVIALSWLTSCTGAPTTATRWWWQPSLPDSKLLRSLTREMTTTSGTSRRRTTLFTSWTVHPLLVRDSLADPELPNLQRICWC